MKLKGKTVLITGSSKHTGYGIAEHCLMEGATVVINGLEPSLVKVAAEQLRKHTSGRVIEAPGDISDEKAVDTIFETIEKEAGRLDVLVLNACHLGVGPNFIDMQTAFWDSVIAVNVRGMFLCGQRAARMMRLQGGGTIINIGSIQAVRGARNRIAYIASKGAVDAATRGMAVDLAEYNIRVNQVIPGYIWTTRWNDLDQHTKDIRRENVPLHQEATYEDVAKAVIFFATEDSKNITGNSLVVDGGLTMQLLPASRDI